MHCRAAPVWFTLLPLALALQSGVGAQTNASDSGAPPARLKLAPTLEPPPIKPGAAAPAPAPRDAIFLRADRLEGPSQKWIEASGKVELRYTQLPWRHSDQKFFVADNSKATTRIGWRTERVRERAWARPRGAGIASSYSRRRARPSGKSRRSAAGKNGLRRSRRPSLM